MYSQRTNQRTSTQRTYGRSAQRSKFTGPSRKSGGFRSGSSSKTSRHAAWAGRTSRFPARNGRQKSQKLDISSFINRAVASSLPEEVFVSEHSFADFSLHSSLMRAIAQKGYTQPTPIQDKIIPLIEKVLNDSREQVLIVTPTRELAQQIEQELWSLTKFARVNSITCVGGEHIGIQIRKLRFKCNFIIGTPGRLIDLVKRGDLYLSAVHTVVLDEADRMLDMGFINDIRFLMTKVPKGRQTLCFSATMSKTIEALVRDFLDNPSIVSVKTAEMPENIEQDVVRIRDLNKVDVLYDLLQQDECKKVLVFGRTKRGVENLSRLLTKRGIRVESIHSNKTQAQRQKALLQFKQNRVQALVATDVAARGLDIDSVTHVINYEVPETYDDYIHRIGRTGRGTSRGKALTFVD